MLPTPSRPRRSNAPVIDAATASGSLAPSPTYPNVKIAPRRSDDRGHADYGWLKTFHTFNFARYHDPLYIGFGALRIINEDYIDPMQGFGEHPHSEMEIFSYIVSGELEHRDSMGNVEIAKRGDVQMSSAGTGIKHSEYNAHHKQNAHILQVWVYPHTLRLQPKYYTRHFTDEEKVDRLVKIVAPLPPAWASFSAFSKSNNDAPPTNDDENQVVDAREAKGPVPIHAGVTVYASIISPKKTVVYSFRPSSLVKEAAASPSALRVYVHIVQTSGYYRSKVSGTDARSDQTSTKPRASVRINGPGGLELLEGDGAFAVGREGDKLEIENISEINAEFLIFDVE